MFHFVLGWNNLLFHSIFISVAFLSSFFLFAIFFFLHSKFVHSFLILSLFLFWMIFICDLLKTAFSWHFIVLTKTPPPWIGCDTRQIFKQSKGGLNSGFSVSSTGCITKAKEPRFSNNLPIARRKLIDPFNGHCRVWSYMGLYPLLMHV